MSETPQNKPDGIALTEQIAHQKEIFCGDCATFGEKSMWAIKSGSVLASLMELRDRRTPPPSRADAVTVPREPTKDMLEEGFDAINKQYARDPLDDALERTQAVYRAMLDAAKPSTTDTKHR